MASTHRLLEGGRTMKFMVVVGLRFSFPLSADDLVAPLDLVMDELVRLDTVDPSISVNLDDDVQVEISVGAKADSYEDAIAEGLSTVRAALHAAKWETPGWPTHPRSVGAELVDA
jgi:hypothetical protein